MISQRQGHSLPLFITQKSQNPQNISVLCLTARDLTDLNRRKIQFQLIVFDANPIMDGVMGYLLDGR